MENHEMWRHEYRKNRYMEYIPEDMLRERTQNILANIAVLTPKGQIGLHGINEVGIFWMVMWTHVLEEFVLRSVAYPNIFKHGSNDDTPPPPVIPTYPEPPKSKNAIDNIGGLRDGQIYKFGKSKHLEEMIKHGVIRISPASYYSDPSLNKAIQDEELFFVRYARHDAVTIKNKSGKTIQTYGGVKFEVTSKTNYFVHCFSSKYTYREFDDFEADACIVISEPRKLFQKMIKAVKCLKPDYHGFASPVVYHDPLNCNLDKINILLAKHFKYSYQNEVRTIWVPPTPVDKLDPFFIKIGSMKKYAEIITI